MSKYTKIDKDTCINCGSCSAEAPDIFAEEASGKAYSKLDENTGVTAVKEEWLEDLEYAQESCPTESVLIAEKPFE